MRVLARQLREREARRRLCAERSRSRSRDSDSGSPFESPRAGHSPRPTSSSHLGTNRRYRGRSRSRSSASSESSSRFRSRAHGSGYHSHVNISADRRPRSRSHSSTRGLQSNDPHQQHSHYRQNHQHTRLGGSDRDVHRYRNKEIQRKWPGEDHPNGRGNALNINSSAYRLNKRPGEEDRSRATQRSSIPVRNRDGDVLNVHRGINSRWMLSSLDIQSQNIFGL
ncbi:unnamed protein product [Protopolystoma xenopodis]|uniref:Uncharacterized protein n=1 Tax=Protopolystoma xenopodis TaxID=117903 RepID=A0A448X7A5_9PLAT|nr:unnamed protein product [Protopolystoma xenopodis]